LLLILRRRLHYDAVFLLILREEAALLRSSGVSFKDSACEIYIATYNMVINSALAIRSRKSTGNLDGVGRS
jgi:hypothetical protein